MEVFGMTLELQTVNGSTLASQLLPFCEAVPKEKPIDDEQLYHYTTILCSVFAQVVH